MLVKQLVECLRSAWFFWEVSKVLTIKVGNVSSNDLALKYLKKVPSRGTSVLNGNFLHMRCGAHIFGLIVRDGLQETNIAILRIRLAVRYVCSSPDWLKRFKECLEIQKVQSKVVLCLDVETRWNSTFLMGLICLSLKIKSMFPNLPEFVMMYQVKTILSYVNVLSNILQYVYDKIVNIFVSKYVTENIYMKEIFKVGWMIVKMG